MSTILQGRPGGDVSCLLVCCGRIRTLDHDVAVFAQSRALHGEGERGPGAGLYAVDEG